MGKVNKDQVKSALKNVNRVLKGNTASVFGWNPETDVEYQKWKKEQNHDNELTEVMQSVRMPWFCPECQSLMKSKIDDKMWSLRGKCFDCVIREETELKASGKFEDYQRSKVLNNQLSWLKFIADKFKDAKNELQSPDIRSYITEFGDVEKWTYQGNLDDLKKDIEKDIEIVADAILKVEAELSNIDI